MKTDQSIVKENAAGWKGRNKPVIHTGWPSYLDHEDSQDRIQDTKISVTSLACDHWENVTAKNSYLRRIIETI